MKSNKNKITHKISIYRMQEELEQRHKTQGIKDIMDEVINKSDKTKYYIKQYDICTSNISGN